MNSFWCKCFGIYAQFLHYMHFHEIFEDLWYTNIHICTYVYTKDQYAYVYANTYMK